MIAAIFSAVLLFSNFQAASASPAAEQKDAKAKLHTDAVRLVEVSGARARVQAELPKMIEEGKKAMMEKCSACTQGFADEWSQRMLQQVRIDDFLDVYIRVYEKYFTDEELLELTALQSSKQGGDKPSPSPALKQKLESVMPSVMGEAVGGCADVGARLGSQVGDAIEKEHPEYVKKTGDTRDSKTQ